MLVFNSTLKDDRTYAYADGMVICRNKGAEDAFFEDLQNNMESFVEIRKGS